MSRNIVAIILGLFLAITVISIMTAVSHALLPFAPDFEAKLAASALSEDPKETYTLMRDASLPAYLGEIAAMAMGAFAGALLTGHIGNKSRVLYGLLLALLLMEMGIISMREVSRPLWYQLTLFFIYIPPAWLASKLTERRHTSANQAIIDANLALRAQQDRLKESKKER